ncbi:NAD-dependent epimerase/dehydratase family protein [Sphingobacterium corticis]|uniref:NAD-dependent epimerase/dehydratase family protein n=1 Tax=Sphingobacterium corticis TaxID=1812823 RepID=A0ABW5NFX4_9SPHI
MKVILTGATGFVGVNLKSYLEEEGVIVEPTSLRIDDWKDKINSQADVIIHLAGKAHDTRNTSDDAEYFKINRDLAVAVFEQFSTSDIKDFFYFSSVKAVADSVVDILTEDMMPMPLTPYGKSKLEAEEYLLSKRLPTGKRVFIIRPCMIHGPGNKGNLNLLYNVVKKGIPWPLASFENRRSFIGIDNLCYLIDKMMVSKDMESGIYQFADDESLSTNDVVSITSKALGKKPKLWRFPVVLVKSAVKVGDSLSLPLNTERLKKLTESYVVSNQKIKNALGINKLPFSAKEGLERTIQSFARESTSAKK